MEVFFNTIEPNYEQIVAMGPRWWTEYREMDANYKYAGWTLDLMAYFLEKLVQNEFPSSCDEETLRLFERILRIEYSAEVSLEERKRIVSAYWSGNGKMSRTSIKGIVKAYTGQNCDIQWEDGILAITITFDDIAEEDISIPMLRAILRRRMPAHIQYEIEIQLPRISNACIYAATDCGMEIVVRGITV